MNEPRFNAIYSGLNTIAQKVYAAVPIAEPWSAAQIQAELARAGGNADRKTVQGCIARLVQSRLVSEPKTGTFIRATVRRATTKPTPKPAPKPAPKPTPAEAPMLKPKPPAAAAPAAPEPLPERMVLLAGRAAMLAESMRSLAEDIELVVLEVQDQLAENTADSQKLRQLQQLLKSLS